MTNPNQPNNPQSPPSNTPSGGATAHEQSQWLIRTINDFTGKISGLEAKNDGLRRDIERVECEASKISGVDSNLSGVKSRVNGIGVAITAILALAAWGGVEMYNLNKLNGIHAEKISMMSKQLEESKVDNAKILDKLDKLLAVSTNPGK